MTEKNSHSNKDENWLEERKKLLESLQKFQEVAFKQYQHINYLQQIVDEQKALLEKYEQGVEDLVENDLNLEVEDVTFSDIGGLGDVIQKIQHFQYGILFPQMYKSFAIKPPKGLLMHGPPGCGKTMIAKAMANEIDSFFMEIPMTKIISKYVGEAERTLDELLLHARNTHNEYGKKVIVFVDEAEQMFRKRGSYDHGVNDRIVNVWLRTMDGMSESDGLIFVAATNHLEMMDDAITRAGRFDYVVEIPKPDKKGIEDILRKQVAYTEKKANRTIYQIDDYGRLAEMLYQRKVTGADIKEVLRITSERLIAEFIESDDSLVVGLPATYIYQSQLEKTLYSYGKIKHEKKIGFNVKSDEDDSGNFEDFVDRSYLERQKRKNHHGDG
ncbi:MAG: ATP-binding protein [Nanoarchaeota archaeon]|nr:ATP-binding protein [Nanoarchaeota archaeon]MBU1632830.1 ATP-binding protein [Nanoarchaeota archaeon]MBU1876477.1 ATP-binding protein [Nanoarchaeota archaeon]